MALFRVLLVGPAPTETQTRDAFPDTAVGLTTAETVTDAQSAIGDEPPETVVTDHRLPDGSGMELLEWIRDVQPGLPVVIYTDAGDERLASDAVAADVNEYVPRTDGEPSLDDLVERTITCARRRYLANEPSEEATMEASLRLKERAMDEAPVGITVADPDLEDDPLVYANDAFERITGYDTLEAVGRNCRFLQGEETDDAAVAAMRQAIEDRRPVSVELVNYTKAGTPFWNRVRLAPIDGNDGTQYFLGFQSDVTDRKEAELRAERRAEEVRAERRSLERLLTRIDGLVEEVTGVAMTARSRDEMERRTCEAFVGTGDYGAAWVGRRKMTTDRVVASAAAGCGRIDDIEVAIGPNEAGAVPVALGADSVAVQPADELQPESIHARLGGPGGAVAAVALSYRDATYGVLVVYADRAETLDDEERAVIDSMGNVLATGINAVENQRLLVADERLELEFEVRPPGPCFVALSERAGCRLCYNGSIVDPDGTFSASFLVEATAPERLLDAADDLECVESVTVVAEYDDGCLIECTPATDSFVQQVADRNGTVGRIDVADGVGKIEVELPQAANPGTAVESLVDRYDGMTLVAQHRRERSQRTRQEFVDSLTEELTDRQLTALRTAHLRDYFEWPRPVDGDDLADSMGVSRSTFHQHLRAAQRKLVGAFVEDEPQPVGHPRFR